jgi:hypothetical protein
MSNVRMIPKTIRLPDYLIDQVVSMAVVSRRSFTKQIEVMLENAIDSSVENDLKLIQEMRTKLSVNSEN